MTLDDIMDDTIYDGMIVVDTNVIVSGPRSRHGASNVLLSGMLRGEIEFALSPAVVLEYEDVLKRPEKLGDPPTLSNDEVDVVLDALCSRCVEVTPWFRFRPFLNDPKDDHVIECALAAGARIIVSGDRVFRHGDVSAFGLMAMSAADYVYEMEPERRMR